MSFREMMNSWLARRCGVRGVETRRLQPRHQVIGVQRGEARHPAHALGAEHAHVDVGAQQYTGIAHEGGQPADGVGPIPSVSQMYADAVALAHDRHRQIRLQPGIDRHDAGTGSAAAVGRGKSLVQVDVHHVEAHGGRQRPAEDGVEVGAVVVEQPAGPVHHPGDLLDPPLEHAQRRRVGQHDAGRLRPDGPAQRVQVHVALRARWEFPRTS